MLPSDHHPSLHVGRSRTPFEYNVRASSKRSAERAASACLASASNELCALDCGFAWAVRSRTRREGNSSISKIYMGWPRRTTPWLMQSSKLEGVLHSQFDDTAT